MAQNVLVSLQRDLISLGHRDRVSHLSVRLKQWFNLSAQWQVWRRLIHHYRVATTTCFQLDLELQARFTTAINLQEDMWSSTFVLRSSTDCCTLKPPAKMTVNCACFPWSFALQQLVLPYTTTSFFFVLYVTLTDVHVSNNLCPLRLSRNKPLSTW